MKSLMLTDEYVAARASDDPASFGVFPGLWRAGEALSLDQLGLSLDEARELIKRYDLPLKETTGGGRRLAPFVDEQRGESEPEAVLVRIVDEDEVSAPGAEPTTNEGSE